LEGGNEITAAMFAKVTRASQRVLQAKVFRCHSEVADRRKRRKEMPKNLIFVFQYFEQL
jgi:hypothetical protein